MDLDLHTLGVIGLAVGIAISFGFTLLGMVLRGLPALRVWAAGFWVLVAGALVQALGKASLPETLLGNGLIALANALMLIGIAVHLRYRLRWRLPALFVVLYVLMQLRLWNVPHGVVVDAVVFGLHSMGWDLWMVWVLLWRSPRDLRSSCVCTAMVLLVDASFFALKPLMVRLPAVANGLDLDALFTTSNYIFGMLSSFLLSTGFTLMLAQRLTLDLQRLARTDGLTGLFNRTAAQQSGQMLAARCAQSGTPCSLLMLDLDLFKHINDGWGHLAGDAVLVHFVSVVRACMLPAGSLFARFGGEEFLLLLPGVSMRDAGILAEDIRLVVAGTSAQVDEGVIDVTTSIGVAGGTGVDFQALLLAADMALYEAKRRGRNCVEHEEVVAAHTFAVERPGHPTTAASP